MTPVTTVSELKDSGTRSTFPTGAVRDGQEGKGRFDLLPVDALIAVSESVGEEDICEDAWEEHRILNHVFWLFLKYLGKGERLDLQYGCWLLMRTLGGQPLAKNRVGYTAMPYDALHAVAVVFELGAKKYAERNWEKGIPTHRFMDSGLRHLWKDCNGWKDEPHQAMSLWNFLCLLQTEIWIDEGRLPITLRTLPSVSGS